MQKIKRNKNLVVFGIYTEGFQYDLEGFRYELGGFRYGPERFLE